MDEFGYPVAPWRKKFRPGENQTGRPLMPGDLRPPGRRNRKRLLAGLSLGLAATIVILCLVFGSISKSVADKTSQAKTQHNSKSAAAQAVVNVPTVSYTSSDFNLSLNYPVGWSVVDSGNGPMTVTSPPMKLVSANGAKVTGLVTMTVQNQGQIPTSFSNGTDLAVLNSQSITYSNPTADQDSESYLSFVQYSTTSTQGGLDAIYLSGNYGYEQDQIIPSSDIATLSPLVTVSFTKCGNSACTVSLTPLTIASSSWSDLSFQKPITTMLTSLEFQ